MGLKATFAVLAFGVATGAFAQPCNFTSSAQLAKADSNGIRQGAVKRTWRGMTDEYWVKYEVAASFPQFPNSVTPAATQINRIVRDYVEGELDNVGPCPAEARLPSRQRKLIAARSSINVFCEVSYFSNALLSLRCNTDNSVLYSAHGSSHREVITLEIVGSTTRRLGIDDIYVKGAEREGLIRMLQIEMRQQDRESDEQVSDTAARDDAVALLSDPLLTPDGLELTYAPDRWRYHSVVLTYKAVQRALHPLLWKRITEHPSLVHKRVARPGA
jgi:hypothetical protein